MLICAFREAANQRAAERKKPPCPSFLLQLCMYFELISDARKDEVEGSFFVCWTWRISRCSVPPWGLMQVPELHSIGNVAAPPARYRHLTSPYDGVHVPDRPFLPNGGDFDPLVSVPVLNYLSDNMSAPVSEQSVLLCPRQSLHVCLNSASASRLAACRTSAREWHHDTWALPGPESRPVRLGSRHVFRWHRP